MFKPTKLQYTLIDRQSVMRAAEDETISDVPAALTADTVVAETSKKIRRVAPPTEYCRD